MSITITEGLAEVKTIVKRIEKKRAFVTQYLARQEGLKDPLANEQGGSRGAIERERQAIADLEERIVQIRRAIQTTNNATTVTIAGVSRSISDWLVWRREVSSGQQAFLTGLRNGLANIRAQAQQRGQAVVATSAEAKQLSDVLVNVDEQALAKESENIEAVLGELDGQLSLKNATVTIAV